MSDNPFLYRKDFGPGQGQPLQASDGEPMSYDEKLAQRVRKILAVRSDVAEKKMFGGLPFMLRGRMFCGVIKEDLVVRVGPHQHEVALQQPHARPMDFTGRPLTGYVYVAPAGYQSRSALEKWVQRGVAFVSKMPAAKSRAGKSTKGRASQ
jgi:TfoX/Sxy family transcriptional regulator of competence genes